VQMTCSRHRRGEVRDGLSEPVEPKDSTFGTRACLRPREQWSLDGSDAALVQTLRWPPAPSS
jgi:hypothetical protein